MKLHSVAFCFLLVLFAVYPVFSQNSKLSTGLGLKYLGSLDEVGSPLVYTGSAIPFSLNYQYAGKKIRHLIGVDFWQTELSSRTSKTSRFIRLDLGSQFKYGIYSRMDWVKKSSLFFGLHSGFLGLEWKTRADLREYSYGNLLWEGYSGLYLGLQDIWKYNKNHEFYFTIQLPFFGWLMRTPYSVESNNTWRAFSDPSLYFTEMGQFTTWPQWKELEFAAGYDYRLFSFFSTGLEGNVLFWSQSSPRTSRQIRYNVALKFSFLF